jgi:hypothetical protein
MFNILGIPCEIKKNRPLVLMVAYGTVNSFNFGLAKTIRTVMGHVKVALRNALEDSQGF